MTLNITFMGICSHFRNTVPGVPHRVVLPDASQFQFGLVDLPGQPPETPLRYYVMPHYAILRAHPSSNQALLNLEPLMISGNVYDGIRVQVANAIGNAMAYDPSYYCVPSIRSFVPDYAYSDEVVLGGRAVMYFDLFSAQMSSTVFPCPPGPPDEPIRVQAKIQTDGPPILLVTPMTTLVDAPPPVARIELIPDALNVDLRIGNLGIDCDNEDKQFDFLLHYLTAKGGIPRQFSALLPGMAPFPTAFTQPDLDAALAKLSTVRFPEVFNDSSCFPQFDELMMTDTSPACADVRYP